MLWRQAVRSVWRNKKAYIACVALLVIGVSVLVSFHLLFRNLSGAMDGMYEEKRFGDGFAVLRQIPLSAARRLESVPGVRRVGATIVADARVIREDSNRVITLRLSSFEPEEDDRLNDFILTDGALPGEDGILLGEAFAAANGFAVGDPVTLVVNGNRIAPRVSGLVQSPEYVYAIPDVGQLMPDEEGFGFGYLPLDRMGGLTGKTGSATNLSFLLEEGASYEALRPRLEEILAPYGLLSLLPRKDQPSHAMLKQEVDSIGAMATSLPLMFIFMAVIILYIMLKRIIEQERTQIGTIKAFGLSNREVVLHYLSYGGITGLAGGALGVALGLLMTEGMTGLYLEFFHLPSFRAPPDPGILVTGFLVALAAGLAGALMGARGILQLTPSEAMRPPAPKGVRSDITMKLPFLRAILTSLGFMAVRNITRNRFRSGFVVVGVAFSFALTAFMASFGEMFDLLMFNQYTKVERYTLRISLKEPAAYQPLKQSARTLEGVRRAEAILELPVELRSRHLKKSSVLVGLEPDSILYRIYDNEGDFNLPPPEGGVILSSALAGALEVSRGGVVTMTTPYTGDDEYRLPVLDVVTANIGSTAYISLPSLWKLMNLPPTASSLILDATRPGDIKSSLLEAERVAAIADQEETKLLYKDMLDSYQALIYMMVLCGVVIAFAIITNTATISLSERKREYATMRVLGLHPREIAQVVSLEYWTLTLLSIPPGILLTRALKVAMAGAINNDIFTIPLHTAPRSFVAAALLCMSAVALSNWSSRRKIARFDMVETLKERE